MPASKTKASTRRLSEVARHVVMPEGIVTTGWPAVRAKCEEFGDRFDGWQDGAGRLILGKRSDGLYAATVGGVVLSIPRQVAKTWLVMRIVFALCVLFPGLTVLWTAHHNRTLTKTFRSAQALARRRRVAPYIASNQRGKMAIRTANGEQEIIFANGSIIMFGSREQGFGRGFEQVDIEVFDEAQILTEKALEDMVAATNQHRHPHGALLFYLGTPPRPSDPGEAFALKRSRALSGKSDNIVYIECSADEDADPDDRDQWAVANPSYPARTPLSSMLRLRENLPSDESWKREALGIWDPVLTGGVIPALPWGQREDGTSVAVDRFALGVECGPDLTWASITLAGQRPDGDWHLELVEDQHTMGRGTAWLVPKLLDVVAKNPQIRTVVVDVSGPISALLEQRNGHWFFTGTRLEVLPVKVAELGAGCARVLDGVLSGWLHHIGQPQLSVAALSAGKRALGDTGMWVWSRRTAESDITPVQAGTLALIGAQASRVRRPMRRSSGRAASRGRRAVIL